ncbi:MAG TPA: ParB/RepB/Spo0J family partition protein [candidate division Zixibacteria bacterium]|nr:ParB/RepB/Spo0J family partition protein [candidate division Zixibacteria bacterium]
MNQLIDKKKVLGRGLDSLLPSSRPTAAPTAAPTGDTVREIPVGQIDRNPYQTRARIDEAALNELAESIKASGVVQPITLRPGTNGRFQLIAGERRWLASQRAGKATVPAIVRQVSNEQAMEITIIENLQREDLNAIEQARAYERLGREFGLTQEQMAQRTGKERSSVANFLRLLKLPPAVQEMVESDKLSFGHAKALMGLDSPEAMVKLAQRAAALSFSVRQVESAVQNLMSPEPKPEKPERKVDPNVREAQKELERALGVRVQIDDKKGKGKIVIQYTSLEDFDRVVTALSK